METKEKSIKHNKVKKMAIAAIAVLLALTLLGGASVALSHAIWHRSLAATYYMLRKQAAKNNKSYESELAWLESVRSAPEEEYELQKHLSFRSKVRVEKEEGMQVYYLNSENNSNLTIFYFHGGAYVAQPSKLQWKSVDRLAEALNAEVVAPIYPLAPHHTYEEAYTVLLGQFAAWRQANPNKTFLFMGDSAGGGLALGMAQRLVEAGGEIPSKLILIAPWVDLAMENPEMKKYEKADPLLSIGFLKADAEAWAGETSLSDGAVSTLNASLAGLPETLIIQGTADIFYPDVMLLEKKMKESGVSVKTVIGENLPHVYTILSLPESKKAFIATCDFVRA